MKRCVFTAVIGDYEPVNPQPARSRSGIDWVCFTDDPDLSSADWDVRVVEPALALDPIRSARAIKIRARQVWDEYAQSLWIDNSVVLRATPESIMDDWLGAHDMALPVHSFRGPVGDEFQAILDLGIDDPNRVVEQWNTYALVDPGCLEVQTLWTALLARRHTPEVAGLMATWFDQVLRHSRRDQLSLPWAIRRSGVAVRAIAVDNHESSWHSWAHNGRRVRYRGPRLPGMLTRPLVEQAAVESRHSDRLGRQVAALTEEVEALVDLCGQRLRRDGQAAETARADLAAQLAHAEAGLIELSTELAAMTADRDHEQDLRVRAEAQAASLQELLRTALGSRRWRVAEALRHPATTTRARLGRDRGLG